MEVGAQFQRLYHVQIQRLFLIIGIIVAVVLFQLLVFTYKNYVSTLSHATKDSDFVTVGSATLLSGSKVTTTDVVHSMVNSSMASDSDDKAGDETEMEGTEKDYDFLSDDEGEIDNSFETDGDGQSLNKITSESNLDFDKSLNMRNGVQTDNSSTREMVIEFGLGSMGHVEESDRNSTLDKTQKLNIFSIPGEVHNQSGFESLGLVSPRISTDETANMDADSSTPLSSIAGKISSAIDGTQLMETHSQNTNNELLQTVSASWSNNSMVAGNSIMNKKRIKPTSISHMNNLLLQSSDSYKSMRPQWSSPRDKELQVARLKIENAPIIRNSPELYASIFRNFSIFKRSYELMEGMLKVYIYKEGEKPIFHQAKLRGIYASEGWFMKLLEGNKQFVVRDPRKAHLFYLPFSSLMLRSTLHQDTFASQKDLEKYLKNYSDIIARKYHFWNRAGGADHFLVACHDWDFAGTLDDKEEYGELHQSSLQCQCCQRLQNRQGRIFASDKCPYFTGPTKRSWRKTRFRETYSGLLRRGHAWFRPILLQCWENKEPDMKILGPMPRDIEGKMQYREYMKSSKYCICARGYEVHTPRVVESIYYECVPVIISDNYVPPFFEVLDWEAFSVFILEDDIPNLRNILLSIPEEKYLEMQQRVKMVQQHFLWQKKPVKYDLFYMILHSVWHNRVFQVKL